MKKAIFPGSFDPITQGHVEIVLRGRAIFDEIIVAIGVNSQKRYLFSLEERMEMLRLSFDSYPQIRIAYYEGLTVEFARKRGAGFLLRGLRSPQDLSYEQPLELINKHMAPELETVHLLSKPETAMISSTIVREVIKYGGAIQGLLPDPVVEYVRALKYSDS
ncbi:MAG: pantetheine-phosphate adenylyltransferase [Bacteroidota bacterium]